MPIFAIYGHLIQALNMTEKEEDKIIRDFTSKEYKEGFVTDVRQVFIPKGLNEDIIRMISDLKEEPEWMLEFRLDAFRRWQKMKMPRWAHLDMPEIDFQDIIYYAAPKRDEDRPKEIDPKLEETFEKLGIPVRERAALAGVVAVDAVFDSVSVATTFQSTLAEKGIIFCSFSEAVKEHPDLIRNTWRRSSRPETTSSRPSIPPYSATAASVIFPKA